MLKKILFSTTADDHVKGDILYNEILSQCEKNNNVWIVLDFAGIKLINTEFLNV